MARAGLVAFAEMTPYVLVGAVGGQYVDRFGAVRAAVVGNLLAAVAIGAVPVLHAAGLLQFGPLLAAVAAAGAANGVAGSVVLAVTAASGLAAGALNPISGAVEYEQVPAELRARVLPAINSISWAGIPLGGLLGGWLAGTAGVTATLLGSAVAYLLITLAPFVFPAWAGMDRPPPVDSRAEPAGMTSADG